jgi:hypothetical protein
MEKIIIQNKITSEQISEDELVAEAHKFIGTLNKRLTTCKLILIEEKPEDQDAAYWEQQAELAAETDTYVPR